MKTEKEKDFEELTPKQQKMWKEIVLARLKNSKLPSNLRLSIG